MAFDDLVRGRISFDNAELDDLIIARSDGSPTYNLTVVVDDSDMAITHVIRGDDHINNTPRQINILRALGLDIPVYAHTPMILGSDGKRLSKRHGAVSVIQYRDEGYLPEALLNYLVRLGWSHGDQELFSVDEMVELFDIADVNRAASVFNPDKLRWLSQQHIIGTDPMHIARHLAHHLGERGIDPAEGPDLLAVVKAQHERAVTLVEMAQISEFFYRDFDAFDEQSAKKHLRPVARDALRTGETGVGGRGKLDGGKHLPGGQGCRRGTGCQNGQGGPAPARGRVGTRRDPQYRRDRAPCGPRGQPAAYRQGARLHRSTCRTGAGR